MRQPYSDHTAVTLCIEWIFYLKDTDGDRAGELLLEACRGGISYLYETASAASQTDI